MSVAVEEIGTSRMEVTRMCHTFSCKSTNEATELGETGEAKVVSVNSRHLALGKVCTIDLVRVGGVSSDAGAHLSNPSDTVAGVDYGCISDYPDMLTAFVEIGADV